MSRKPSTETSTAIIGFEAKLWLAADKLRNNMDAAEYKHVVLGLIFLKYISDTFEEHRAKLLAGEGDYAGANPEDPAAAEKSGPSPDEGPKIACQQENLPVSAQPEAGQACGEDERGPRRD